MSDDYDNDEYYLPDEEEPLEEKMEIVELENEKENPIRAEKTLQARVDKVKDKPKIALDYTLETAEERNELVKKIIASATPEQLTPYYLDILGTYIVLAMDPKEKKSKMIQTPNHLKGTVYVRETSFQGLASSFEQGEDGLYNLITDFDKNIILTPKDPITQKDIDEIPELKEYMEEIARLEEHFKKARGKKKYLIKKWIIEMHQDKYLIRASHRPTVKSTHLTKITSGHLNLDEEVSVNEKGDVVVKGLISCCSAQHVATLLSNYSKLREECWGKLNDDLYYQMEHLDDLIDQVFVGEENRFLLDIIIWKIDGVKNEVIRDNLIKIHGITYSEEYISSLWKNKIPKMIAEQCQQNYLEWYYTVKEKGKWKKCSCCGNIKLANHHFFSKNSTSKDGFYSICKVCRSKKYKEKKDKILKS